MTALHKDIPMTSENAPGPPVPDTIVLIHGLWMTPLSWEHWTERSRSVTSVPRLFLSQMASMRRHYLSRPTWRLWPSSKNRNDLRP
jgi:hypothetical protein